MEGFKNTTRMRTFTGAADINATAGRTVGRVPSFAQGGRVFARGGSVPDVDPNHASSDNEGHGLVQRQEPTTEELSEAGGTSPLKSGYAKGGGAKHFHVHKHYHSGGKIKTKTRSYSAAEKAAEREAEGAKPMMATGGTRNPMAKGGKSKIHIKEKNRGALHRDMGVPQGKKIPKSAIRSKLAHDKASGNTKGVKRDVFALNFGHKGHAEGGHIHDETHIPPGYPDYATGGTIDALATGGTINPMNCGGAAYGGMATGGTQNRLAGGGGALGALMARRGAPPPRPAMQRAQAAIAPVLRARGGPAMPAAARQAAKAAVREHVASPAPRGHKGLGRMLKRG